MLRRLRPCLVVVCAVALAGCDLQERLPESDKAMRPGSDRMSEPGMGGDPTLDHRRDDKRYVVADPL